jgi:hypothetical protein
MPRREESSEAEHRGGAVRSSEEMPVMGMERRSCIVQVVSNWSTVKAGGTECVFSVSVRSLFFLLSF